MEFERILIYLPYGVIIRDKVGNYGQFDDKTIFGNESNLHKNSIYSQCFLLNLQFMTCSFFLCSPMKYTFSFQHAS